MDFINRHDNAIGAGLVVLNLLVGNFLIAAFIALVWALTWTQ
jgi:hypothetical protein